MSELTKVDRVVAYKPEAGDVVVLEVHDHIDADEVHEIQRAASLAFGHEVEVVVICGGVRFTGVVKKGDVQ